jgi:hypothetical protein
LYYILKTLKFFNKLILLYSIVCCGDNYQFPWNIKHYHNRDNQGNLKSQDIILLQWNNNNNNNNNNNYYYNQRFGYYNNAQQERTKDIFLRSHDLTFTVDNENYQEVVAHDQRIGGNDQVQYCKPFFHTHYR